MADFHPVGAPVPFLHDQLAPGAKLAMQLRSRILLK